MKRILYRFITAAALTGAIAVQSCNVLEIDPTTWYSETVAFGNQENLDLYVKGLYGYLYSQADIAAGYVMDDFCTDLAKSSWFNTGAGSVNKLFYLDNVITQEGNFRSNWSNNYTYIRRFNEFFLYVSQGYADKLDKDVLAIRMAEVRFLRAHAYQELVLRHGGVILRVAEDYVDGPAEKSKARSTEKECWDWILSEYDKAAAALPEKWSSGDDLGRATKGAALAMKARAALYAGEWETAVTAATQVIDDFSYVLVSGTTADSYYRIFSDPYNSELILPVYYKQSSGAQDGKQHNFNYYFAPPGDGKTRQTDGTIKITYPLGAAVTPTEEYASSFDIMSSGVWQSFDWEKHGAAPYENREPRFYASILYNGASWYGRTLELYDGGIDGFMQYSSTGQDNDHRTTTGYIFRKFMANPANMNYTTIFSGQYWIEMRLAEIYLIRSEANARLEQYALAYDDLNVIRARVGLPAKSIRSDWYAYVDDLAKERVCELGLEGHRYWDLMRWGKLQEVLDGKRLHGVMPTVAKDGSVSYEVIECDTQDRHYPERYNIFPIPYSELKTNSACTQNEQWL